MNLRTRRLNSLGHSPSLAFVPSRVVLDSDDLEAARDRLAVNIHLMFQNQENRRFAYGLVITETGVTVYMFDHSGAVSSQPCNYHQDPEQFWA